MSKIFFYRLVSILIFVMVFFVYIPYLFKDILFILISIIIFISTFDMKKKTHRKNKTDVENIEE